MEKYIVFVASPSDVITPLDVFIDIARNGSGESVKLLREHHIYPETIEHILKQEHLKVLRG